MKTGVAGVILAAGLSKRMGRPKMMLPYNKKTIVRHVIDAALRSRLDSVHVVINPQIEGLLQEVSVDGVMKVISNDSFHLGMSTSVKKGILAMPHHAEAVVFLLGDQPGISEQVINQVIGTYQAHDKPSIVRSAFWNDEKGHPVLFKKIMFKHLLKAEGDSGGKAVLQRFSSEIVYAELNQANIPDIDTLEDYEVLVKEKGG
ncbi:nucleotidyltransferase family protein [Domibacillus sp. A3M-37]|uniref:nucleotidyltransferase family protein n=1 Tax=Domibacillus sp. A3M-37 TaxID=2962037 RepID=UPI0020B86B82|nr:nucleotidyltransferase family protein [Domibacillus sp. A3M-37]MCP3761102.1 nucleotidyltransferase family protein [Domibacillus sp. A3M-37]